MNSRLDEITCGLLRRIDTKVKFERCAHELPCMHDNHADMTCDCHDTDGDDGERRSRSGALARLSCVVAVYGRPGAQSRASRCPSAICAKDILDATASRRRRK